MAINNDPNFPPSGPAPYRIDRTWCLGDSLAYINANSINFDNRIETLSSNVANLNNFTLNARQPLNVNYIYVNASTTPATYTGQTYPGDTTTVLGGNDATADGSLNTPFLTLSAAVNYAYKVDVNGPVNEKIIEIRLCPGYYVGCGIYGSPVGHGFADGGSSSTLPSILGRRPAIRIRGSGQFGANASYITQFYNTAEPAFIFNGFGTYYPKSVYHLDIGHGANVMLEDLAFRYTSLINPFMPTALAGGGTETEYKVVNVYNYSTVSFQRVTWEAIPLVLTNSNPQAMLSMCVFVQNHCTTQFRNVTVRNGSWGSGVTPFTTQANFRYFIKTQLHSDAYFYNNFTLARDDGNPAGAGPTEHGPRFSAWAENTAFSYIYQDRDSDQFVWNGNFGTRLGTGVEDSFPSDIYLPNKSNNYIMKADGPFAYSYYRHATGIPTTARKSAFAANRVDTRCVIEGRW